MTGIAVCIVSFREPGLITTCLDALARSTYEEFEIVICENGGEEARRRLATSLPVTLPGGQSVTLLDQAENLGYAGGVNACIAARPGAEAWWILNPDTCPAPAALDALVRRLQQGDCDAAGGVLHHPSGKVQAYGGRWHMWLARAVSIGFGAPLAGQVDQVRVEARMNYLLGACMLVSRRFVAVAGTMRDDYFLYAEEIEWCLRARAQGLRLGFAPDALICHGQGGTTGSAAQINNRPRLPIFLDERNKLLVVRDTAPMRLIVAAPLAFIFAWARFGRRGALSQWRNAVAGWWAGLCNQRGVPRWLT